MAVSCPSDLSGYCMSFGFYLFHFFLQQLFVFPVWLYRPVQQNAITKGKTTQTPSRFYWSCINTSGYGQWILLLCRITKLNIKTYLLLKDLQVKHLLIKLMKKFESVLSLTSLKLYRKWRNGILFVQESITTQSSLFMCNVQTLLRKCRSTCQLSMFKVLKITGGAYLCNANNCSMNVF